MYGLRMYMPLNCKSYATVRMGLSLIPRPIPTCNIEKVGIGLGMMEARWHGPTIPVMGLKNLKIDSTHN